MKYLKRSIQILSFGMMLVFAGIHFTNQEAEACPISMYYLGERNMHEGGCWLGNTISCIGCGIIYRE